MDTKIDDIDPAWWEDVLTATNPDHEYDLPELLCIKLQRAANAPGLGEFQRLVINILAMATSAMLNTENWLEPFTPAIQMEDQRTVVPSDLDADQVTLLARIAPLVTRHDLRARVADIAWVYGDRSNVTMLDMAIESYRAAPLTDAVWFGPGRDAWVRALALANRRGPDGHAVIADMSNQLKEHVLAANVSDQFRTVQCAQVLRNHGRVDAEGRAKVSEALFRLAANAADVKARLSRHLEREAVAWLGGSDTSTANAAVERIARTYISEADGRIEADPKTGALVEGHFLEKAIAVLRTLPRSFRVDKGLEQLIDELRTRLHGSRESTIEQMMHFESDPVDLTEAVSYARARVAGHTDRLRALAAFATLVPPMKAEETVATVKETLEDTLSHTFGSSTFSQDHRKVASRPSSGGNAQDDVIWSEIVRTVQLHTQLIGTGIIQPAQEVLTRKHQYSREYMVFLCRESPSVPERHERLWGAGLAFGLAGDYGTALALLAPQLEQVVRTFLKRRGVYTLHVDDQTGVESEKGLNALLEIDETVEVFGAGQVMEMKAILVSQGGPNLRNDTAHGLLDDNSAWSYTSMYLWWFCLRLVMLPIIHMYDAEATKTPETGNEEKPAADGTEQSDGSETGQE